MDLFYSNFNKDDKLITINQIDSKHITKSFRKNMGDLIKITNGNGSICDAKIIEKGRNIKVEIKKIVPGNSRLVISLKSAYQAQDLIEYTVKIVYIYTEYYNILKYAAHPQPILDAYITTGIIIY